MFRLCTLRGLVLATMALLVALPSRAQTEKILDSETGWSYLYGANSTDIANQILAGMRPFSIKRVGSNVYDVVSVANTGSYAVAGFGTDNMHYNRTTSQLATDVSGHRIVSLDCFELLSTTRMNAISVPNGAGTVWGWQVGRTRQEIVDWINESPTPLRILDLSIYWIDGQKRYAATAVANQGANFQNWWWYFEKTGQEINDLLEQNNARLVDIELEIAPSILSPARFACVMVAQNPGAGWFYSSLSSNQVNDIVGQTSGRLTNLHRYTDSIGGTRYAVSLVDNANAQTRRMRTYMGNEVQAGSYGFKLKRIGGPVLASLHENFVFEPASSLKILHAAYTVRQAALAGPGSIALTDSIFVQNTCESEAWNNICPDQQFTCLSGQERLSRTIRIMMSASHNGRTRTIEELFGREVLNDFAQSQAGLSNTQINHTMGCLQCDNDYNASTCADLVTFYEQISNGTYFDSGWRDTLWSLMANTMAWGYGATSDKAFYTLGQVIDQEAASTSLTTAEIQAFRDSMKYVNKGGAYGCANDGPKFRTTGAWASIPIKVNVFGSWIEVRRDYAIATFVHQSTDPGSMVAYPASEEILREQIREALQSWDAACQPGISSQPVSQTVDQGEDAQFTTLAGGAGAAEYQWQRRLGLSWSDLPEESDTYSGVRTHTLTIHTAQSTEAGSYRCRVTKICGTTTTAAVTLTVVPEDVTSVPSVLPTHLVFHAPHPNPFNPRVTLRFELPRPTEHAVLEVFDLAGRRVRILTAGSLGAGLHEFVWTGIDEAGKRVASGMYLARLSAGGERLTQRMTLVQ